MSEIDLKLEKLRLQYRQAKKNGDEGMMRMILITVEGIKNAPASLSTKNTNSLIDNAKNALLT